MKLPLALVGATLGLVAGVHAQQELPKGVTAAMVTAGEKLFKGAGLCSACHGANAKGVPGVGPDLTDGEWVHSKGSYEEIVKQVLAGVTPDQSKTGTIMPPKGGSQLTDEQVREVSAYVWSISQQTK
jgi:mono/diheme cytochrome c family protein